jgi:hypothetical protein
VHDVTDMVSVLSRRNTSSLRRLTPEAAGVRPRRSGSPLGAGPCLADSSTRCRPA